jgi:carbonic anhydrase/acetyltransferase-like protein (isoleucine patch superfamily)
MIQQLHGFWPIIGEGTFVAETAAVIGDVVIGKESSVWYSAVVRGDVNSIRIGDRVSIQDCSCLHCAEDDAYIEIGNDVTVGHNVCLHGCKIDDSVLIGMGATVLDNVHIASGSVVAAGALVLANTEIGPGELWGGVPAKLIKKLDQEAIDRIITPLPKHYQYWTAEYLKEQAAMAPDLSLD